MKVIKTALPDLLILEPRVFEDDQVFFFESFHEKNFTEKPVKLRTLSRTTTPSLKEEC